MPYFSTKNKFFIKDRMSERDSIACYARFHNAPLLFRLLIFRGGGSALCSVFSAVISCFFLWYASLLVARWDCVCSGEAGTGKGISESNQAAIFRRFYREEEVHEQQGVGIGQYLAREIVTRRTAISGCPP
jgi:hypothetical protein